MRSADLLCTLENGTKITCEHPELHAGQTWHDTAVSRASSCLQHDWHPGSQKSSPPFRYMPVHQSAALPPAGPSCTCILCCCPEANLLNLSELCSLACDLCQMLHHVFGESGFTALTLHLVQSQKDCLSQWPRA